MYPNGTVAILKYGPGEYKNYVGTIGTVVGHSPGGNFYHVDFNGRSITNIAPEFLDFDLVMEESVKEAKPSMNWETLTQEERAAFVKKIIENMYMDKTLCSQINELIP